jgi:hypothetical protein
MIGVTVKQMVQVVGWCSRILRRNSSSSIGDEIAYARARCWIVHAARAGAMGHATGGSGFEKYKDG